MNILILGSGGREHAFALKLSESSKVKQLFVAPGNAGTNKIARNINVDLSDFDNSFYYVSIRQNSQTITKKIIILENK